MCCVVDCQVHPSAPRVKVCIFVVVALSLSTAADLERVKVTLILAGSKSLPVPERFFFCLFLLHSSSNCYVSFCSCRFESLQRFPARRSQQTTAVGRIFNIKAET